MVPVLDQFKLVLEPLNSPFQVNILDAGEGLAQVLPILVAAAKAGRSDDEKTRILAAEEPESHLHPRLHGALAERFCELASQNMPPQLLLETHSENLLLRVQIQIVRGDIDPGRVLVYWVRQLDDGRSIAEPVTFDSVGRPQGNWPAGVFSEDVNQARTLIEERRKRSAKS